jgi:hypothetical protein
MLTIINEGSIFASGEIAQELCLLLAVHSLPGSSAMQYSTYEFYTEYMVAALFPSLLQITSGILVLSSLLPSSIVSQSMNHYAKN